MEIIKKKTTLKNLNFIICLRQNIKNLGLSEDISDDIELSKSNIILSGTTDNKLGDIRSFDFENPFIVGINGVTEVTADYVIYKIDDIIYKTNLITKETSYVISKEELLYKNNNFIRNDNFIGLSSKVDIDATINIDRSPFSVIERFSKLQQIGTPDELAGFDNNFYKVYDQTL